MTGKQLLTARGTVYPWQCDHMGHMNVMWYVGKFDEATWQLFTSLGLAPTQFRGGGVGMAAVQQELTYQRELFAGSVDRPRRLCHRFQVFLRHARPWSVPSRHVPEPCFHKSGHKFVTFATLLR